VLNPTTFGLFAQAVYQRTLLHSLPKVVESYRAMSLMTLSFTVLDNRAVTRRCLNPRVVRCRWRPAPSEPRPARELVGAFLAAAKSLVEPHLPPRTQQAFSDGHNRHHVEATGIALHFRGRSPDWFKMKNPEAPGVKREAERPPSWTFIAAASRAHPEESISSVARGH
jgi:hypothetical protein